MKRNQTYWSMCYSTTLNRDPGNQTKQFRCHRNISSQLDRQLKVEHLRSFRKDDGKLTARLGFEEVVLQAALGHVLVHQQELLVLPAVPQQPHQIGVRQPSQEIHLGLHSNSTIIIKPHGK
jgi:hypothetical protein